MRTILLISTFFCLQGCIAPIALNHAVMAYNQTTSDIQSQQLLLNIARAHRHHPLHFTGISNIAATFNFQFNAGATPALTGTTGSLITPIFGGTISENPTVSIVPIEGEEFTRRLLSPLQENKLTMLLRQGVDVDLILRLVAGELRLRANGTESIFNNKPSDSHGYRHFRQLVLQLSTLQDRHLLHVEPLQFDQSWELPVNSIEPGQLLDLQKEFNVQYDPSSKRVRLTKPVTGHIVMTNYDLHHLSNAERMQLNDEADRGASNDMMIDIRPEFSGGEIAIHGFFRLRSFYNVLNFIGRDLDDDHEFAVEKLSLTPAVKENPVHALAIRVSEDEPEDDSIAVYYDGLYYAVNPESGYQWNQEGFRLLYQIYQMTMAELSQRSAPQITISK